MIRLYRPLPPPSVLTQQGKRRAATYAKNYEADETAYRSGAKTFAFDGTIYAHETVKSALIAMHHEKCCYCERVIGSSGDIEHFRPKGAVSGDDGTEIILPGYYWLAYDWDNLLYACKDCNQLHKKMLFPLADPLTRARSHKQTAELSAETPLLINPAQSDPTIFLSFREEYAYAVGGDANAACTIGICGLNRPDLLARRATLLQVILGYLCILQSKDVLKDTPEGRYLVAQAESKLTEAASNAGEFLNMVRAAFVAEGL